MTRGEDEELLRKMRLGKCRWSTRTSCCTRSTTTPNTTRVQGVAERRPATPRRVGLAWSRSSRSLWLATRPDVFPSPLTVTDATSIVRAGSSTAQPWWSSPRRGTQPCLPRCSARSGPTATWSATASTGSVGADRGDDAGPATSALGSPAWPLGHRIERSPAHENPAVGPHASRPPRPWTDQNSRSRRATPQTMCHST